MGDLPLYSKVFREITTTNAAASWAHTRLPSYSKFRNLVQCYVFLFAKMNRHSWLLKEEGAHLAASKRLIRSSSDNSSPDIDLGDQLLTNIGSILYVGILVCCTVDTVVGTDAALLTSITSLQPLRVISTLMKQQTWQLPYQGHLLVMQIRCKLVV